MTDLDTINGAGVNDTPSPDNTSQTQPQQAQTPPVQTPQSQQGQTPSQRSSDLDINPEAQAANADQTPVRNTPPQVPPAVQRAGWLYKTAEALAGGPRYRVSIDPSTGQTTRTQVPVSRGDIAMSIAMEALSGALSGLSVPNGPGNLGRAAGAGGAAVIQQKQQAQQQQEQQAQTDANNQASALARKATIFETNMRGMLNAAELEKYGSDAIDKVVQVNRESGLLDPSPDYVENGGQPMTQAELNDAIAKGTLNPTDHLGPIAGRVEATKPDGTKFWETTHLVLKSGDEKVPLTQADWDRYASAGVKGYSPGAQIGNGVLIPLRLKALANEQLSSHVLSDYRLNDLRNVLDGTQYAGKIPTKIDWNTPGVETAMQRYQTYVSHDAENSADPYLALKAMGADKRDAQGQMKPNPDAKYVDTIAAQMGGWPVLEAAHNELLAQRKNAEAFSIIDSESKANAVLAAPKKFSSDQVSNARSFLSLTAQQGAKKAREEAVSRAVANGTDVEAMYRFGRNPVTGEQLSLANAPDAALVTSGGQVIPQDLVSTYKPTSAERTVADSARTALDLSNKIATAVSRNPDLVGPLMGRDKKALSKLGLGDQQAQELIDNVSLLQSAVTKMHVGGRFSTEVLKKSSDLLNTSMNTDQLSGALSAINGVAQQYANEDRLTSVADYKARNSQRALQGQPQAPKQVTIPAGAQVGRDAKGNVVGYKLPNGTYVPLGGPQ